MDPPESVADILNSLGIAASLNVGKYRSKFLKLYVNELRTGSAVQDLHELHLLVKSCLNILKLGWPNITRTQCRQQLKDLHVDHSYSQLDEAIDVALRMWFMIDSRDDSITGYPRHWATDETIQDVVRSRFPQIPVYESEEIKRFPRNFRAVDLARISGIIVQWTDHLDEHLRFDDDDENRTLKVFNNKAWLLAVINGEEMTKLKNDTSSPSSTFVKSVGLPRDLLEETLKTLDVLFPPWHDRTVQFLNEHNEDFYLLPPVPRDLPRLREFAYWRERLIDVIVEFQSPPRDWKYVWRDRRSPVAFWTFWIGLLIFVLTLIFGIVSSLISGLALRAAVEQLKQTNSN